MDDVAVRPAPVEAVRTAPRRQRKLERLPGEPRKIAYLYLLPAFLIYAAFNLVPLVQGFNISFYNWDG